MFTNVKRMVVLSVVLAAVLGLGMSAVWAADAHDGHGAAPAAKAEFAGDPYLLGTDPVSGEALGEKPVIYQHDGRELRFAKQKNLDAFKAEPAKYLAKVDQQMVEQQLPFYPLDTCMVSGDKLGGDMGKPVDLIYKNRLVRFCCDGCIDDVKKDPTRFIGKLDAAVIAKQTPTYPMTTCLVSGDKLGGDMGKPVDMVVGNRLVRFCCPECIPDFKKNPTKYLNMLDAAARK